MNDNEKKEISEKLKVSRPISILMIIAGVAGLIISVIFMLGLLKTKGTVKESLVASLYVFIPFVISFLVLKIGLLNLGVSKK